MGHGQKITRDFQIKKYPITQLAFVGQTSRLPYELGWLSDPPHKMGNLFLERPQTKFIFQIFAKPYLAKNAWECCRVSTPGAFCFQLTPHTLLEDITTLMR
jgi:hypothetical protein